MRKIDASTFIKITTQGGGNLFPVAGAFILILSLAMPLFSLHYTMTSGTVYTLEALLGRIKGTVPLPAPACISILYNFLLGLYVLLAGNYGRAPQLAVAGIALAVFAATRLPVPPGSLGAGAFSAMAGLVMVASGFFSKPRQAID